MDWESTDPAGPKLKRTRDDQAALAQVGAAAHPDKRPRTDSTYRMQIDDSHTDSDGQSINQAVWQGEKGRSSPDATFPQTEPVFDHFAPSMRRSTGLDA